MHELAMHRYNSFVTLTYSDENLPPNESLNVEDWQKFAKRLRKRAGPFRFYMCGEYGELVGRPHYHALLFGLDFHHDRFLMARRRGYNVYRSALLEECWPYGFCEIGSVGLKSVQYVAGYITKRQVSAEQVSNGVKREFNLMSRRPGIGAKWLERFRGDVFPDDMCVLEGRRFKPPRFYEKVLSEQELEAVKMERARATRREHQRPEVLRRRERNHEARRDLFKRV